MKKVVMFLSLGVLLAGCQLGQTPTFEEAKEKTREEVFQSAVDIETIGEIDVATVGMIGTPVRVKAGQDVLFVNSGDKVIGVIYVLDQEKVLDLGPGGKLNFVYPGGFPEVEFKWGEDGGVVLQRADVD